MTALYERFISLVIRRPALVILAVVAITGGFSAQLTRLTVDADTRSFMPRHDPALANLDHLEDTFGSPYLTRIIIERNDHPQGVYNPETLGLIVEITDWLKTRPEFQTDLNSDLRSLSTVNNIIGDETGMVVKPFIEEPPNTQAEATEIRRAIEDNGIYVGLLAGYSGRAASIVVRESEEGRGKRVETFFMLRNKLDQYTRQGRPEKFYITGRPVLEGLFGKYIPEESQRTSPVVVLMLAVLLYVSFRSLRGVLIPFVVIGCTELWMLGFLGLWGHPFYTITSILPVLLIAIAVADSIHLMAKYYEAQEELGGDDKPAVVRQTMRAMGAPVMMTSLTTAVGFLSMTSAAIVPIRDFGILAAFAVMAAFVISITVIPAILMLVPLDGRVRIRERRHGSDRLNRLLLLPARVATKCSTQTAAFFGTALIVAMFGMVHLTTDSSRVGQFPPWHHLRIASDKDTEHFAGSMTLDVMIETNEADGIKSPDLLKRIDRFQTEFE
ncbi:MAG: RND family transporter, partial [Candidatus Binatia bacterium]